jgi:DNA-binding MarR family transcriptional regulator
MTQKACFDTEQEPQLGWWIHQLDHAIYQAVNRRFLAVGLTVPQARVMEFLYYHEGERVNQRALEEQLQLSNPSVTSLIRNLVDKGLVSRHPDSSDGRSHLLRLTPEGRKVHPQVVGIFEDNERQLVEGLRLEEVQAVLALVRRMKEHMER